MHPAFFLLFAASGQLADPAPRSQQEPAVPAPAAAAAQDDPDALFRRVVAAQLGDSKLQSVEGFHLDLNLRERGETAREVELEVRYRREGGGRVAIRVQDPKRGTRVAKGFDGERFWLLDDEDQLLDLSAREYTQDRDAIDDALDLCEELLLVFDLERLRSRAKDLAIGAGEVGGPALTGVIERKRQPWRFRLHLGPDGLQPQVLDLVPPPPREGSEGEAPLPQRYLFRHPALFEGRRMPRVIDEFVGEERVYPVRMLEIRELSWRQPPSPASLAPGAASGRREPGGSQGD